MDSLEIVQYFRSNTPAGQCPWIPWTLSTDSMDFFHWFHGLSTDGKYRLLWGEYKFRILGINFNIDLEEMVAENYEVKLQELEKVAIKTMGKMITITTG